MSETRLQVLIAGRSRTAIDSIAAMLRPREDLAVTIRHVSNGHADPLYGVSELPHVLILHLSLEWEPELEELAARPAAMRPPTIVLGTATDARVMRRAMQAGARDFFVHPVAGEDLLAALERIAEEHRAATEARTRVTAVINAKGGSGATFLACNLGHAMAAVGGLRVAALDLDLQFGTLALYLDLALQHSITQALTTTDGLDATALEAFMSKHASGLHVLGPFPEEMVIAHEISAAGVGRLLAAAAQRYEHVVVDLPRQIDHVSAATLERADTVLVTMQQSVGHLRDAKRLVSLLDEQLGVSRDSVTAVVNRFQPRSEIGLKDVESTLRVGSITTLPNDFERVTASINAGIALREQGQRSALSKAIVRFAANLNGRPSFRRQGLGGVVSHLLGMST